MRRPNPFSAPRAHKRQPKRKALTQQVVTAGMTGVRQAFSQTVASGLTPARLAGILHSANQGDLDAYLVLAEEMEERDPHYQSVLAVRKRAVAAIAPVITAASEDKQDEKIADFVREKLEAIEDFPDIIFDMLDAVGKGFSVSEIIWSTEANQWKPVEIEWCDPRFFRFDRETGREIRLIDESDMMDGLELDPFKYIIHRPRLKTGLAFRGGIARLVAFTYLCKAYTSKDWIAFIECYGLPLRLGKYGPEATADDVDVLFRAVSGIGTDAAAVLPMSMNIEFQEIADGAGNGVFEKFARWADEQISKAVLGQTMTSDNGSSMAQAEVHDNVRHDILAADARQVSTALRRDLIEPIVDLNFGPQDRYPKISLPVSEPEDIAALVTSADKLMAHGLTIKASEAREKLGFSEPDTNDDVIGGKVETPAPHTAVNRLALNRQSEVDPLDEIEAAGLEDWEEQLAPILDPVLKMIAKAESYEDALTKLPELVPDMDSRAMIESLMIATVKARAEGKT